MFPGVIFNGHVDSVAPASGQEFAAAAARQRHRQFHQDRAAHSGQDRARRRQPARAVLRPGMSVNPTIDTRSQRARQLATAAERRRS